MPLNEKEYGCLAMQHISAYHLLLYIEVGHSNCYDHTDLTVLTTPGKHSDERDHIRTLVGSRYS
jgi:hypothetical protein